MIGGLLVMRKLICSGYEGVKKQGGLQWDVVNNSGFGGCIIIRSESLIDGRLSVQMCLGVLSRWLVCLVCLALLVYKSWQID